MRIRISGRRVALVLLLAVAAAGAPPVAAVAPPHATAGTDPRPAPLPVCRYRDDRTRYARPADWRRTLLDTNLRLPRDYRVPDLVPVSRAGIAGSGRIRAIAIADLRALAAAARRAGNPIAVRSAFRTWEDQAAIFATWVRRSGRAQALRYSARPGHSEHQLGVGIDFMSAGGGAPWAGGDWGSTPAGRWMARNAWRYGWLMSYPPGEERRSCYGYEPWHWRYVGRERARVVRESGLPYRVWLWRTSEGLP
ncbi:MAG: D-alanyl-D-alanine carboxypeptidase family protein [Chloroflexota bacterium]